MHSIRIFVQDHFALVLLCAAVIGMIAPIEDLPNHGASIPLALLTYASCFKLRDGGFSEINWWQVSIFYCWRYVILPIALLALSYLIIPEYALGVFLLALVPAAVSSPCLLYTSPSPRDRG